MPANGVACCLLSTLASCAVNVGQGSADNASIHRIESTTPVRQNPVNDAYIVNHGGKVQVIPDERYEPRPSKK